MYHLLSVLSLVPFALGGTLQFVDHQGQCFVYSTNNFGCTGISEPFAPLDGTSCSSKRPPESKESYWQLLDINLKTNETNSSSSASKVMLCGSSQKGPAWVKVHENGFLNFHNEHGDDGNCTVDKSLENGSLCTISNHLETSSASKESQLTSSDTPSTHVSAMAATPTMSSDSPGPAHTDSDCWFW